MTHLRFATAILALCFAILAAAPGARAQAPPPAVQAGAGGQGAAQPNAQKFMDRFRAADTTHDGRLTLAQAQAGHMPAIVKNYDAIDEHHIGYVTLQDIRAWRQRQRASRATPVASDLSAVPTPAPSSRPYPTIPPAR